VTQKLAAESTLTGLARGEVAVLGVGGRRPRTLEVRPATARGEPDGVYP
jgi:hypothetical protein